ncbi:hypothetical protein DUNSADRAFT_9814 [Dunaliella salina]|uniref:Uncharacterized protein n=1 Tax=Dunaliella salina TaxID=3046 RepID=A0ABQ7GGL2_DUNSA|nr:hypothetical protein DUNSADRAFT_9814 [Dunaliella salina]KAF5833748.1 hypothetical protein DUNSADRAFT_9814 [Dunaliella salina]|eukprot:KAF5833747.1 hypothetical protein DUNSADRAFT_9814 [Dunaliella salina]
MLSLEGLSSRLSSGVHASSSSRCCHQISPALRRGSANGKVFTCHPQPRHYVQVVQAKNARQREPADILAETDFEDNDFRIIRKGDVEPDLDDPEWHQKIVDWGDFWNYQRWDLEVEGLDLDTDVAGNETRSLDRAVKLINAIHSIELRTDVLNWIGPETRRDHSDFWIDPPVKPVKPDMIPEMSDIDLRALSEKMKKRELMDIEWRRQQSKIGKIQYYDNKNDVRLQQFVLEKDFPEWTPEQVYNLVTLDGTAARPEDHGGIVENPLVNIDMVNTMGVRWIPDTEDFLEEIGHLGVPSKLKRLPKEVVIDLNTDLISSEASDELLEMDEEVERFEEIESQPWDHTYTGDPREWTSE